MRRDLTVPAAVKWHPDEEDPPEDWSDALVFPTLREALEAIANGTPQTGHPWILCRRRLLSPSQIEEICRDGE